jgi:hypothetical protein
VGGKRILGEEIVNEERGRKTPATGLNISMFSYQFVVGHFKTVIVCNDFLRP